MHCTSTIQASSRLMRCRTMVAGFHSLSMVVPRTMGTWMQSLPSTLYPLQRGTPTTTATRILALSNPSLSLGSIRWSSSSSSSSLSAAEIQKRLDDFQTLFVEARLCIEDVQESAGTKYFDEDAQSAKDAVQEAIQALEQLIQDIEDPNEKNRILRGNGLKVEQLKGELDLALQGGHDH